MLEMNVGEFPRVLLRGTLLEIDQKCEFEGKSYSVINTQPVGVKCEEYPHWLIKSTSRMSSDNVYDLTRKQLDLRDLPFPNFYVHYDHTIQVDRNNAFMAGDLVECDVILLPMLKHYFNPGYGNKPKVSYGNSPLPTIYYLLIGAMRKFEQVGKKVIKQG